MKLRQWIWVILGLAFIFLPKILPPSFIEFWYSRGLYLWIRKVLDYFGQYSPIPFVTVLLIFLLFRFFEWLKRVRKNKVRLSTIARQILNCIGAFIFFFQFLWGLNYGRVSIEDHLGFEDTLLTTQSLTNEFNYVTSQLKTSRSKWGNEEFPDHAIFLTGGEDELRKSLQQVLQELGYPSGATVRGRIVSPKGILMRNNGSGIYIPYSGEGHIDKGLHQLRLPFVMAHEMSHGYGFADEGTCNFLAYLACINSDNEYFNYSGQLAYWKYLARDMVKNGLKDPLTIEKDLPQAVQQDLQAIRKESKKYPDLFPKLGKKTYNKYLKAQGIKEGMDSYNKVVNLAYSYRTKEAYNKD